MDEGDQYSSKTLTRGCPFLIGPSETITLLNAYLWLGSSRSFTLFCTYQKNILIKNAGKIFFSFKSILLSSAKFVLHVQVWSLTLLSLWKCQQQHWCHGGSVTTGLLQIPSRRGSLHLSLLTGLLTISSHTQNRTYPL